MPVDTPSPLVAHARSQSIGDLLRRSAVRDPGKIAIIYRGVRQTWISLLRHPDFGRRDLSSLRKGYYGASIMPVEVLKEMARELRAVIPPPWT